MIRTIIFDVDGVLLDWFEGFNDWMHARGFHPKTEKSDTYDMTAYWGLADPQIAALIKDFNRSAEFGVLPHVPGALQAVRQLRRTWNDCLFVAITCAGIHPKTMMYRAINLLQFELDALHVLPLRTSKFTELAWYSGNGNVLIFEDHIGHALEAASLGMQVGLLNWPWNQAEIDHPNVRRYAGWSDVMTNLKVRIAA